MKCPFCDAEEMVVTNSRSTHGGYSTWRRRKCIHCLETFTTYEKVNLNYIIVKKKNLEKTRYSHYKLFSSIFNAFLKMKHVDIGDCAVKAEKCTTEIEKIMVQEKIKEISTKKIFELTVDVLLKYNPSVAMNYFSYFGKDFKTKHVEELINISMSTSSH